MVSADPAPKPIALRPAANPRRSGNHFNALPTHVPYTAPAPTPPTAAAMYKTARESAMELSAHDTPTKAPPDTATGRGPSLSTRYPSSGTSQVSATTKMVNATWIAALLQWYLSLMGLTNNVHPY